MATLSSKHKKNFRVKLRQQTKDFYDSNSNKLKNLNFNEKVLSVFENTSIKKNKANKLLVQRLLSAVMEPEATEEMNTEWSMVQKENKERNIELLKEKEEKEAIKKELAEQRHKRLMHLLTTSQFYSQFMLEKFNSSKENTTNLTKNNKRFKPNSMQDKENLDLSTSSSQENCSQEKYSKLTRKSSSRSKLAVFKNIENVHADSENVEHPEKSTNASATPQEPQTEKSTNDSAIPREEQPKLFENGTLRPYQLDGFSWLKALFENGINGILADEMGLGKTVQTIALFCHLVNVGIPGPFLVVAPLSTLPNWISEFKRFAPKIPVILYHGPANERKLKQERFNKKYKIPGSQCKAYPVIITNYKSAVRDAKFLKERTWRYLVVDEGHKIKNYNSLLARTLCSFPSANRTILTGTPLQNDLTELWSLLNFLLPDIFDNLSIFESWFEISDMMNEGADQRIVQQEREKQIVSTIHKILNPFLLRRVKNDVELELPSKKELLVYAPMTQLQLDLYKACITNDYSQFKNLDRSGAWTPEYDENGRPKRKAAKKIDLEFLFSDNDSDNALDAFLEAVVEAEQETFADKLAKSMMKSYEVSLRMSNKMMQCRKIVNHPYLIEYPLSNGEYKVDEDLLKLSGKLQVLDQLLEELHKRGHRVLVFSQMTKLLNIIEDYLTMRPQYRYKRLDGRVRLEDRTTDIEEFNSSDDYFLFLLSTRAGGLGINLTSADTVIIYDSDWNPQMDLQAQDRCHRIGQSKPVLVLRFVTASTIDQEIVERAAAKRKLEKIVMKPGEFRATTKQKQELKPEELLALLQTRDHDRVHRASMGNGIYTQQELDELLDRSDLTEGFVAKHMLQGVFKTISNDQGTL